MRVKDLIDELEDCDGEKEVVIYDKLTEKERKIFEIHPDIDGKVFIDIFDVNN